MKRLFLLLILVNFFLIFSCSKNEEPNQIHEVIKQSSEKEISDFAITIDNQVHTAIIRNDSILYELPSSSNLTALSPKITISNKASISPSSGEEVDFSNTIKYTVTAEDKSKKHYTAAISRGANSENTISSFIFKNTSGYSQHNYSENSADIDTLSFEFPYGTDVSALMSQIEISDNATVEPASGAVLDYSTPIKYEVVAEDGSVFEILVMATIKELELNEVKIGSLLRDEFVDAALGGTITFAVSEIHPEKDNNKVRLFSTLESFDLEVQSVNMETKEITVVLPNWYINNNFNLKVTIEENNSDISDGFILLKGRNNYTHVLDYYENSTYNKTEKLIWPGQFFYTKVYIKNEDIDGHDFFLLKDQVYYPLKKENYHSILLELKLEMPDLPQTIPADGNDFKFVIRNAEGEEIFDLINSDENLIEVEIPSQPVVSAVSPTTIHKNETLTITGTNLYIPINGSYNTNVLGSKAYITFKKNGSSFGFNVDGLNSNGDISFDLNSNDHLETGTYEVWYSSNVATYGEINTGLTVTVVQPPSEHATLDVSAAKIYSSSHASLAKQILLNFNENIDNYVIKKIVTGFDEAVVIENYFTYPTSVLTGAISNDDFQKVMSNRDGYVVVEDGGVEYKIYFVLVLTHN